MNDLGSVFSESIYRSGRRSTANAGKIDRGSDSRLFFILLTGIGFFALFTRLFSLTVVQGEKYKRLSEANYIREEKVDAPRGIIYDRNGVPLVRNIPAFADGKGKIYFEERPRQDELLEETVARDYIYSDITAHVLGYTGEIDESGLSKDSAAASGLSPGDIVGKSGIEKAYDSLLRGREGRRMYEVDATGNKVRVLGKINPSSGKNLYLTLDINLQKEVKDAMGDLKGAVVVTDPQNGEVLSLYSNPSFDPNAFVRGGDIAEYLNDPKMPLFNRTISGLYPPGSIFKIITAVSALEEGKITRLTKFEDTGVVSAGGQKFGTWAYNQSGKKEGFMDIVFALKRSNDIFFYRTGEEVGIEKLHGWAEKMGVGVETGIDIDGEEEGLMPDPEWKEKVKGEKWYLGNTYNTSIGQGDILATPIQASLWSGIIAGKGKICTPHLLYGTDKNYCRDSGIKPEYIELVRQGMKEACEPGGTGWPFFNFRVKNANMKPDGLDFTDIRDSSVSADLVGITNGCKTGTAEFGDAKKRTHAWFTVFAPFYNPRISVTVLVEEGGEGSSVAAPIAAKILQYWFAK